MVDVGYAIEADPAVHIMSPVNGTRLTNHLVNITGNATGSEIDWIQTSKADFDAGGMVNISSESPGSIRIVNGTYDDFNDNLWDDSRWERTKEDNGIKASETCGTYIVSGQANTSHPTSRCWTVSKKVFYNGSFSVDLLYYPFLGYDSYGTARVGLFWDQDNYLSVGIGDDGNMVKGYRLVLDLKTEGSHSYTEGVLNDTWGPPGYGPHHFQFIWNSTEIDVYVDGIYAQSWINYWGDLKIFFDTEAYVGARIIAIWDNVTENKFSGRFISRIFDSQSDQSLLKNILWNATVPDGTNLSVFLRSSDNASMETSTPWALMENNQSGGQDRLYRYIQYQVVMTSTDGIATPILDDIEIDLDRPVMKVEVSVDNKDTWRPAHGKTNWYLVVNLEENQNVIWARVTDINGAISLASITVDVDTTPPVGSVRINHGDRFTITQETNLTLNATDRYGVVSMIVSEDPDFKDAGWQDYRTSIDFTLTSGDGKRTVYAKFRDSSGWESEIVNDSILLDTAPPVGSVIINDGAEFTNNNLVSLSLRAEDLTGVSKMELGNDAGFSKADWEPYHPTKMWNLPDGDGVRFVYARFLDAAGHESSPVNDSIILDTSLPTVNLSANGGAIFTTSDQISLEIAGSDDFEIPSMMLSENPGFDGSVWEPFQTNHPWNLSSGDGAKKIYAKAQDIAGNIGPSNYTSIVLDTTPPASAIAPLPVVIDSMNVTLEWNGSDATSGIQSFDLQYKDGNGPWTDWRISMNATKDVFSGVDGHSYSFRIRARDNAGNLQHYPDSGTFPVKIDLPIPGIVITSPGQNSKVRGTVNVRGIANDTRSDWKVTEVLVCIDNGNWEIAQGTNAWSFNWRTLNGTEGRHTIHAKAFDGRKYSVEANATVLVDNGTGNTTVDTFPYSLLGLIVLLIVVIVGCLAYRYRKKRPRV
jgi:hypothetical protein